MRAVPPAVSAEEIRDANTRYHDVGRPPLRLQVGHRLRRDRPGSGAHEAAQGARGRADARYRDSLEIGAGTGYFTLNLLLGGVIENATCSDISPGMLRTLSSNAGRLGLEVATQPADAERLPFADESFDLVFGHAVLHHIPDLPRAFEEFERVLRPGRDGAVRRRAVPSRRPPGALSRRRSGAALAPLWRRAMRRRSGGRAAARRAPRTSLEPVVDVHAFAPGELAGFARDAGLGDVRVSGEELVANWFGWVNRTLEHSAEPEEVPWAWRQYAYHGYLVLQQLDRRLLESLLPASAFYNLMLSARKPPRRD